MQEKADFFRPLGAHWNKNGGLERGDSQASVQLGMETSAVDAPQTAGGSRVGGWLHGNRHSKHPEC